MPANMYQILYGAWDKAPSGKDSGSKNRFGNYEFGTLDSLNWLIQTGGDINFILQMRDIQNLRDSSGSFDAWLAKDMSADWQVNTINIFIAARDILNGAGQETSVNTPKFFIGSVENIPEMLLNTGGRTGIYDQVVDRLGKNSSVIAGAYYGEDFKDQLTATSVSTFIHEWRGKALLWIPYYHLPVYENDELIAGDADLEDYFNRVKWVANMTHDCGWGSRPLFDTILLQPGTFYYNGGLNREDIFGLTDRINGWNEKRNWNQTMLGLQFEFDMGLVTGRDDPGYTLDANVKRQRLNDYFSAVKRLNSNTPIGIYSGGPNEHGYSDPKMNANEHNTGNHRVEGSWQSYDYMNGVPYNKFPVSYNGNLIYDINNYLFRDMPQGKAMNQKLYEFLSK